MWWQKYFHPVVLECFQGAERSSGKVISSKHLNQEPPSQEYPAKTGFYQHKKKDTIMHNLELLHKNIEILQFLNDIPQIKKIKKQYILLIYVIITKVESWSVIHFKSKYQAIPNNSYMPYPLQDSNT